MNVANHPPSDEIYRIPAVELPGWVWQGQRFIDRPNRWTTIAVVPFVADRWPVVRRFFFCCADTRPQSELRICRPWGEPLLHRSVPPDKSVNETHDPPWLRIGDSIRIRAWVEYPTAVSFAFAGTYVDPSPELVAYDRRQQEELRRDRDCYRNRLT